MNTQPRRITTTDEHGDTVDITEGVQVLYDLVTSSMDWGSGFWTEDDIIPIRALVAAVGFPGFEVESYLEARAREEANRRKREERDAALLAQYEQQQRRYEAHVAAVRAAPEPAPRCNLHVNAINRTDALCVREAGHRGPGIYCTVSTHTAAARDAQDYDA